jgi:alkanesulfonate monooxygenase SsuD/methylene tetrahydromethanopterin reductase-like flavin-dependent oxidoreductase (luciferase family)/predicted kinase
VEERAEPAALVAGTLVVLIGAAGSGKSTWARAHFPEGEIVSTDAMRALVGEGEGDQRANRDMFAIIDAVLLARVRRRLTTVIDSTALESERRAHYLELGERFGVPVVAVVFRAGVRTCLVRNAQRERKVPQDVIRAQVAAVVALASEALRAEGFTEVIDVRAERGEGDRDVRVVAPAFADTIRAAPSALAAGRATPPIRVDLAISRFSWPGGAASIRQRLAEIAGEAEEVGIGGIWLMDHYRQIPQVGAAWEDLPELISTLGFLAGVTSRVRLGSLVASISARSIQQLARSMASLDVLSNGRMVCGIGAGWFEAEAAEIGVRFPALGERFELLEDALRVLPLFWGKGGPTFDGRHLQVPKATAYPRPLQDPLPLLVGGSGRRTLRLAAQYANAVNVQGSPATVAKHLAYLRDCIAAVPGRSVEEVEVTHLGPILIGDDDADLAARVANNRGRVGDQRYRASVNAGTVQDQARRLASLAGVGVRTAIVSPVDLGEPGALRRLGHLIEALGERSAAGR